MAESDFECLQDVYRKNSFRPWDICNAHVHDVCGNFFMFYRICFTWNQKWAIAILNDNDLLFSQICCLAQSKSKYECVLVCSIIGKFLQVSQEIRLEIEYNELQQRWQFYVLLLSKMRSLTCTFSNYKKRKMQIFTKIKDFYNN
jgi:hypothetical protein